MSHQIHMRAYPISQSGLSLVEIMIAVTISVVLLAGVGKDLCLEQTDLSRPGRPVARTGKRPLCHRLPGQGDPHGWLLRLQ